MTHVTRWFAARTGRRVGFGIALVATTLLAGSVTRPVEPAPVSPVAAAATWLPPVASDGTTAPLTSPLLRLRAGPVPVPLELLLPTIGVAAPVLGVGITDSDVMDAPMGPPGDPVWQSAFWYRGSAVPGAASTAVIAGHVDGGGLPASFAHLDALRPGDPIVVRDTRTGDDLRFTVTGSESIPLSHASDPDLLNRIYGPGPVSGSRPLPSDDGQAHLNLVTCAGAFTDGTHDHRLVVHASRPAVASVAGS